MIYVTYPGTNIKDRINKANKIITILKEFKDIKNTSILDIGVGSGVITHELSKYCKKMDGIDVTDDRIIKKDYNFKIVKGTKLPFRDNVFDIIVSNHVIEHIKNQKNHIDEIYRVLKPKGILYLATPNKYWPIEVHYHLPLLSLLPIKISTLILKLTKRSKIYDIYPLSYNKLLKLLSRYKVFNLNYKIIKNPKKYYLKTKLDSILKRIPVFMLKLLNFIYPTYILIGKKDYK